MVCTANICRSPVAAALLEEALSGTGISVGSAGTQAVNGAGPDPNAVEYVQRRIGVIPDVASTPLTPGRALNAGLVLTMTEHHRAEVARMAPSVLRRAFTVRQFVRIAPLLPSGATYTSLEALVEAAARCRALAGPAEAGEDDIEDPYGESPEQYGQTFDLIARTCSATAETLLTRLSTGDVEAAASDG
ncbi:MAG: low molecular weight phosphatase family protein [Brachybacterium sp.]|uniref:arsenate reductase/protein-tyrosine-phosphatase family protein n=1 Tax=Brachybacterium sp. TaxID=1891286 RepID=UPI002648C437|nr:low molecular weight phosphatase family protein [Brachybacterium sp.]MDN5686074.1 low molecular weight phosphatase family protein [Brachybacterium sp.]